MAGDTIVLYDLPSAALPDKAWSPNVWKIRFLLNYKCLPYRTEWIETPDLAPFAKKFGAPPSFFTEKGVPRYTAPIIYCPRARSFFSNSLEIAIYLERAYPDTPPLFHGEFAFALVRAWDDLWNDNVAKVMEKLMMMRTYEQFPPRSAAGFRMSRERIYGIPLEAHAPPEQAPALWKQLREALTRFHLYIDGARFVAGNEITYPDVISAGWLVYVKRLCGQNSEEWCQIELWNEGRWKKLMEVFSEWEHTDAAVEVLDARSGEEVSRVARL